MIDFVENWMSERVGGYDWRRKGGVSVKRTCNPHRLGSKSDDTTGGLPEIDNPKRERTSTCQVEVGVPDVRPKDRLSTTWRGKGGEGGKRG